MEVQFTKWGNSLAVRVPSKVAKALGIEPGRLADLDFQNDKLTITPRSADYSLDDLVAGITEHNLHGEISTGSTVGAEVID